MTHKPWRIIGHEPIINKIGKCSTPANDEFGAKLAAILDFNPFMLSKLFKTYFIVFGTFKTYT